MKREGFCPSLSLHLFPSVVRFSRYSAPPFLDTKFFFNFLFLAH